jgi:hypothetical protein
MNKKQKNLKKASAAIAKIGLDCYQKGLGDSLDILSTSIQSLKANGVEKLTLDEVMVLVEQVRSIATNGIGEAQEPAKVNGSA